MAVRWSLQSMRNNLRQNFQEKQKMCLPSLSIIMLTALVLSLLHFCERDSGGLFHCAVTTNFIIVLIPYYPYLHGRFTRWSKWRACDVGEANEGLENELWRRWSNGRVGEWVVTWALLIFQTFPSLHLRHSSFSNPSVALPTSQLILQPFRCFTYVTVHSPSLISLLRYRLFTYVTWRAAHGDMDSNDKDKISGHSTVEQATTVSFTEMKEGVAPISSAR